MHIPFFLTLAWEMFILGCYCYCFHCGSGVFIAVPVLNGIFSVLFFDIFETIFEQQTEIHAPYLEHGPQFLKFPQIAPESPYCARVPILRQFFRACIVAQFGSDYCKGFREFHCHFKLLQPLRFSAKLGKRPVRNDFFPRSKQVKLKK